MTTNDKSKHLTVSLNLINNKLNFVGTTGSNDPISIDYTPPLGDNLGYTSLELFLLSFSSCVGSAVLVLLRKMGKTISGFEISASGIRKEQHPTCFSIITLDMILKSSNTVDAEFEKVIGLADEKLCPVWAMVKGNVEVTINPTIIK